MKKRFLSLLLVALTAVMCLRILPLPAQAATYGDLTYSVSDGKVTITDCATTASGELVIPDTIEGYPVTTIGSNAFSSCKNLTTVVIPETVTYIGMWAFSSSGITSIEIPEGVKQIGENAFHSCKSLVDVTIPSTLTYIGNSAFNYCDAIENVYISDLQSWCQINFYSAWSNPLNPAEHLYLNGELLSGEVTIPEGTASIGKCAFNTGDITHINVPDSVTKIDEYGFYGCASLQWIDLPNTITTIDSYTFNGCASLSHISFPDSVTTIEDRVINNSGITTIHLGKNVKSIWNSAFQGASNLSSFTVSEENPNFSVSDDILFSKDGTKLLFYPPNKEGTAYTVPGHVTEVGGYAFAYSRNLKSVTLPDTVTTLGDDAFAQCKELTSVKLSSGLTELPSYLFSGCSALTTVEIPASVKSLDYYAFSGWTGLKTIKLPEKISYLPSRLFEGCTSLESVEIPENVTRIDQYAFRRCTALTEITFPKNVNSMDSYVFYYCDNLENVYFTGDAPATINNYAFSGVTTNVYYPFSGSGWDAASAKQYGGTITWQGYSPAGVAASGTCGTGVNWVLDNDGCLVIYGSGTMTNYSTSSGITNAPWRAYAGDITSAVVCKDITSVGNNAFSGCEKLETLEIRGDNVSVGRNIIYGCAALDQVEFTGKIPTLNSAAFTGCSATIRYPANDKTWMTIVSGSYGGNMTWKPRGQTEEYIATGRTDQQVWTLYYDGTIKFTGYFGLPAYSGGTAPWYQYRHHIKTLNIGTLSNVSSYAFYDCPNLTSIIWPVVWNSSSGFTGIGERAFYNCDGLTYLFLPPDETIPVGKYAFYDCDNLKWVAFSARTSIGSGAFSSCDSLKTLYINDNYPHSRLSIAADGFSGVTANVCYPVGSSINSYGQTNYGGTLTWKATYYGPCNETVNWEFDETTGTLTISGTGSISNKYGSGNTTPWSCFQDDIKQIVVEEGIDYLPNYCFEFCDQVTTVSLPNTLRTLSLSAFNKCTALNNLILPDSITEFDADRSQFNRCNSLTDLYFFGTKEEWDAIPNSNKVRLYADNGITMTIHYLVQQGSEPTCTEPGMKPHYRFDDTSVYSGYYDLEKVEIGKPAEIPASGHDWIKATCDLPKTCDTCGATEGEALGHDEISHAAKDPTCEEIGWDAYVTCSRCDYSTYAEKPALNHDIVSYPEQASTCDQAGWNAYEACTRCDYTTYKARPLADHVPGEPVTSDFVPSSCTQKGSYVSTVYCSNCVAELSRETIEVPLADHSPNQAVEENRVEATCTEAGSYDAVTYCDSCGGELDRVTIEIPLKEHVRGEAKEETRVESTCTEAGYYELIVRCTGCGHVMDTTRNSLPLADHTPGAAVVENRMESTCTQKGSYDLVVYCTQCSAELKRGSKELPLAEHTPGDAVEENRTESTCTVKGSYDSVVYCTECSEELSRTANELPLAEHTSGEAVEENRTESTCLVNGHYDAVVYCAVCTEELSRTTVTLPLVDHTYVEGICSVCGWIEGLEYEIRDGEAVITGFTGPASAFDLPGTIEGYPVTTIDRQALAYKDHLTYVGIPENVTDIEFEAFRGCPNLTRISIPSTLKTIVTGAFKLTDNITRIDITDLGAWCEIEQQGYDGGSPLSGGNAYLYLDGKPVRGNITIPEGTERIGSNAFYEYSLITGVTIPEGVTSIGSAAFIGCENLQRVSLPDSVQKIDDSAFYRCLTLSEIELGSGVREIGPGAFESCRNLKSVSLPDTVTSIGPNAFFDCQKLTEIHIPAGVKSISDYTFQGCSNLKKVTMAGEVTSIGEAAFAFAHALTDIELPDSVTTIKENAFMHCYTLESIDLPENLTTIGAYAFQSSSLTEVRIPDRVETIGAGAFRECSKLETVVIPYDVLVIGSDAFAYTDLKDIYYGGSKVDWTIFGSFAPTADFIHYQCTEPDGHWYADETDATCTEAGYSRDTCACGYEKNRQEIPKLPHTEVVDEAVDATCTKDGKTEGKHCSVCGTVTVEQEVVEATGHKEVTDAAVAATCTEDGKTEGKHCSVCGTVTKAQETVKATGHKEVTDEAVAVTCTEDGKTEGKHCSVCGTVTKAQEVIKATGHKEVTDKAVAATCTTDGKTEGKHCSVCGTVTVAQQTVKATGHSFANGKCGVCGAEDPNYVKPTEPTEPQPTEPKPEAQGVTRVFGDDRYQTAFKAADTLKAQLGVSKFQNIIVASGTGFADALAGSYLAAVKNAPILLVKGANVNDVKDYIKANLASGGTVYLLGGVNAVPQTMETGLDGYNVKRLGGADRYDTNLLILKEAGVGNKDIIVCTGLNFADSLSASASGLPILLVKGGLTDSQKNFLASTSGKKIIVGGTAAVSATVENQLKTYGSVKRLAGDTRYDTSVLVAKEFFSNPKSAVLAYAQNFPDGLSGGPLAYALKAPLILTDSKKPTAAVNYATGCGIKSGYALGGTGLISDKVVKNIFSMTADDVILVK